MDVDCSAGAVRGVHVPSRLTLEKLPAWSSEAERALSRTLTGSSGNDRETIVAAVNAGRMELWRWCGGLAYMVTQFDGRILTVHCVQGAGLAAIAPAVMRIARDNGAAAVEFFTLRQGLDRLLRRAGVACREAETIYRCEVA